MPSVNREQFLAMLESCVPGLAQKEIIDQSRCFVFKDGVTYAYNDECACRVSSTLDSKFQGAVHHEHLLNCLRKLQEETIDILPKDGELVVKGKNKAGHFRLESKILMPIEVIETPNEGDWKKLHDNFCDAIGLVQKCAGMDDNKFAITCVHITPNFIEAGDYFQLCRWNVETGFTDEVMIRRSAVKHVAGMAATEFAETEKWVHFRNARGLILSCRRYTDVSDYPNLTDSLSVNGQPLSLPKALEEAVDRAGDFLAPQGSDHDELCIDLKPGPGGKGAMRVTGRDGVDWYEEVKRVDYAGQPMSFMLPPAVLSDIVKKHKECEVTEDTLIVKGGSYKYITGLTKSGDTKSKEEKLDE